MRGVFRLPEVFFHLSPDFAVVGLAPERMEETKVVVVVGGDDNCTTTSVVLVG